MESRKLIFTCLRWVAVLPASYAGAGLAQVVVLLGYSFSPHLGPEIRGSFFGQLIERTVSNGIFGIAMVGIAAYVAPTHKTSTGILVAGLYAVGMVVLWLIGYIPEWWDVYAMIVAVLAALATAVRVHHQLAGNE